MSWPGARPLITVGIARAYSATSDDFKTSESNELWQRVLRQKTCSITTPRVIGTFLADVFKKGQLNRVARITIDYTCGDVDPCHRRLVDCYRDCVSKKRAERYAGARDCVEVIRDGSQ